jgi:hypothetical protein
MYYAPTNRLASFHTAARRLVLSNILQKLFWLELTFLFVLFGFYVYFISVSVVHVVLRQEAVVEIAALNSRISEYEAQYLTAKHSIDATRAAAHGFHTIAHTYYIAADGGKVSRGDTR